MILRWVIVSPILPFMEDPEDCLHADIIENIQIFPYECDAYRQALLAEQAWKPLRLVCRSWELMVSDFHQGCIFAHDKGVRYLGVNNRALGGPERIQIVGDSGRDYCSCVNTPCFIKGHKHSLLVEPHPCLQDFGDENLRRIFRHIQILTVTGEELDREWSSYSMPKLQALELYHPPRAWGVPVKPLLALLPDHSSLTYLQLDNLTWIRFRVYFSSKKPFLQSLRYLALDFNDGECYGPDPEERKIQWNSPKLRKLVVRGSLDFNEKEAFNLFLQKCGETVTEYVVTCSFIRRKYILPHIRHFPHLFLYGVPLSHLFPQIGSIQRNSEVPYPRGASLHTLIIFGFHGARRCDPEGFAVQLASLIEIWGFKEIRVDSIPEPAWLNKFLSRTVPISIILLDLKGVEIRNPIDGILRGTGSYATRRTLALRI
jgi:hypothetical protein